MVLQGLRAAAKHGNRRRQERRVTEQNYKAKGECNEIGGTEIQQITCDVVFAANNLAHCVTVHENLLTVVHYCGDAVE